MIFPSDYNRLQGQRIFQPIFEAHILIPTRCVDNQANVVCMIKRTFWLMMIVHITLSEINNLPQCPEGLLLVQRGLLFKTANSLLSQFQ